MSRQTKPRFASASQPHGTQLQFQFLASDQNQNQNQDLMLCSSVCLQAIHKLVDYLSYQVRLVARELVDAFDVPDQIIRAPIGMQSEAYAQYTQGVGFYRQPT